MVRFDPHRHERLEAHLLRTLSTLIKEEVKDPRLAEVTLIRLELSRDYSVAKIDFAIRGDREAEEAALEALRKASGFLRGRLAEFVNLRRIPELRWRIDKNISHMMRISQLIEGGEPTVPPTDYEEFEDPYGLLTRGTSVERPQGGSEAEEATNPSAGESPDHKSPEQSEPDESSAN